MKKLLLFMAMAIVIASCSKENEVLPNEENSIENLMKSSNDISTLYDQVIESHFSNPDYFDNLS